jgi:hypothetical protein
MGVQRGGESGINENQWMRKRGHRLWSFFFVVK